MADQEIGRLLILLEANTAKLDEQIKTSKAHFDSMRSAAHELGGALAALGAVEFLKTMVEDAADAEKAQALLVSQLKATGDASGQSLKSLVDMADKFQQTTTFSHVQVEQLESELLAFTNITGDQFQKTIAVILDFATVTGRDASQAVRTLGQAINNPTASMGRLTQAGISLDEATKEQIKSLQAHGHLLEAQDLLLKKLESSYGGAAEAARNTLGGALIALKNDFTDILEGKGGVADVTSSIKELDDTIRSPDIKSGLQNLVSGLTELVGWAAKAASAFTQLGQGIAVLFAGGQGDAIQDIGNKLGQAKKDLENYQEMLKRAQSGADGDYTPSEASIKNKIAQQQALIQQLQASWDTLLRNGGSAAAPVTERRPGDIDFVAPLGETKKSLTEVNTSNLFGEDKTATAYEKYVQDQQKVRDIWKENDPEAFLKKQIDDTKQLIGTVVDGQLFTTEDAQKHIELLKQKFDSSMTEMTEFSKQAARNIQDEFAKGLFDGFHHGLKGMLESFVQTLEQMVDQLIASQLLNQFFGSNDPSGKNSGQAGLAAIISHGLGSMFGGGHASGGPVDPSQFYLVGEQGPELFAPTTAGSIIPNSSLGGSSSMGDVNVHIDARGAGPDETARLLAMSAALENSIKSHVEHRLQRGGWPSPKRST